MLLLVAAKHAAGMVKNYQAAESAKEYLIDAAVEDEVRAVETAERAKISVMNIRRRGRAIAAQQQTVMAARNVDVSSGASLAVIAETANAVAMEVSNRQREANFAIRQIRKAKEAKYQSIRDITKAQLTGILTGGLVGGADIASRLEQSKTPQTAGTADIGAVSSFQQNAPSGFQTQKFEDNFSLINPKQRQFGDTAGFETGTFNVGGL